MLSQYIGLIEDITNQSTTMEMNEKLIKEITGSAEALSAFYTLRGAESAVHSELISRLDADLEKFANSSKDLKKDGPLRELNAKYGAFYFHTDELTANNVKIGFQFDSGGYNDFSFGFVKINLKEPCPVGSQLLIKFTDRARSPWTARPREDSR